MVLEFEAKGPRARAVLSYSESTNESSRHFSDQTRLFSESRYRPILFTEDEILGDPNLEQATLEIPKD
jgi:acyl-homoserine-lactone acylase